MIDSPISPISLALVMSNYPFKDPVIANRFAEGIIKAGMPGPPSAYLPAYKENQLTGKEIKSLLFGSKITGFYLRGQYLDGWWIDFKENGDFTWQGVAPISSDSGKSRIEGDFICTRFKYVTWGDEYCMAVFRNPNGTREGLDEYFRVGDYGFYPFSPMR